MKRITPEEVVEAYKQIGAKPARGVYYKRGSPGEPDCCCGLGAVVVAANDGIHPPDFTDAAERMCGDDFYVGGFLSGFDGDDCDCSLPEEKSPRYAIGYDDGRAAAIAVGLIQE